jgi:hypothetical protein
METNEANRARACRQKVQAMFEKLPQRRLAPVRSVGIEGATRDHSEMVRAIRIVASVRALFL